MVALALLLILTGMQAAAEGGPPAAPTGTVAPASEAPAGQEAATEQVEPRDPREALASAPALMGKKEYDAVLAALEPLMASGDPAVRWPATFWVARARLEKNDTRSAARLLLQVIENHEPMAAQGEYWLGQAYMRMGRYKTARDCFARAEARADDAFRPSCAYQAAYTHYVERHYERAAKLLEAFLRDYPDHALSRSAEKLIETARERLRAARKIDVQWVAGLGVASTSEITRFNGSPDVGLGANARLGFSARWEPLDGTRASASAFRTRTSYLTGDLSDREGTVAQLSLSRDLGNARSVSYGLTYSTNQRTDLVTSDSETWGVYGSYAMPVSEDGRLSVGLGLSRLRYHFAASSGAQETLSLSYSEPLARSLRGAFAASLTNSNVGADYLSYSGFLLSTTLSGTLSTRRSLRGGFSYSANDYDAPYPRETRSRSDRIRRFYGEYSQRLSRKVTVSVGWQETNRGSTLAVLDRSEPSWYVRTSQFLDLRF